MPSFNETVGSSPSDPPLKWKQSDNHVADNQVAFENPQFAASYVLVHVALSKGATRTNSYRAASLTGQNLNEGTGFISNDRGDGFYGRNQEEPLQDLDVTANFHGHGDSSISHTHPQSYYGPVSPSYHSAAWDYNSGFCNSDVGMRFDHESNPFNDFDSGDFFRTPGHSLSGLPCDSSSVVSGYGGEISDRSQRSQHGRCTTIDFNPRFATGENSDPIDEILNQSIPTHAPISVDMPLFNQQN